MFGRQAFAAFSRNLAVNTAGLNDKASSALLAETAQRERDRVLGEQAGLHAPPGFRQIVDGVEGAAFDVVRPDGVIVLIWSYLRNVVAETYGLLVERSPRDQGGYIAGLKILVDDVEATLEQITASTRSVEIVATVPYALRLEIGRRDGGGPFVLQVAPHIVEETALVARRLFGNLADITYSMVDIDAPYILKGTARGRKKPRHLRYPAILFRARGE